MSKSLQPFQDCSQKDGGLEQYTESLEGEWISREQAEHDDFVKKAERDFHEIQKRRFEMDRNMASCQALGKTISDIGRFL